MMSKLFFSLEFFPGPDKVRSNGKFFRRLGVPRIKQTKGNALDQSIMFCCWGFEKGESVLEES